MEDSPATIQSRLLAARASLYHAHHIAEPLDLVPPNDGLPKSWLHLEDRKVEPTLIARLTEFIPSVQNFRLLILDPLPAFLGTYDCSHQASVRRLLRPLIRLAEQHHFAILGITHLSKSTAKKDLLHRLLGSIAYTALARSVLLLTYDDLTHQPDRRLLIPLKHNFAKKARAYAFNIIDPSDDPSLTTDHRPLTTDDDPPAILEWETTPITRHPLLTQSTAIIPATDPLRESRRELAIRFIKTMLAKGPLPSAELLKQAHSLGISQSTFDRARDDMELNIYHEGPSNKWYMALPTYDLAGI